MKPILLAVSLLANAAILAAFAFRPALAPAAFRDYFARGSGDSSAPAAGTAARAAKTAAANATAAQPALWSTLSTNDLAALVARLRAAGFPISAIRAVLQAELNERYGDRMRALSQADPDAPFWKSTPSLGMDPKRMAEYMQLASERSKLMRELLGNFASRDDGDLTAAQRRQYGTLPSSKIDQIDRINADYAEMTREVRAAMNNIILPEDREKLALLEREKRADLVALLSPEELADYDMRNSQTTTRLRPALASFNATEEEFRTIYKIQESFAERLGLTNTFATSLAAMPPQERTAFMQQRATAQKELDAAMQAALGAQRYAEFVRSSDRDYQQLTRLATLENLPPQTATQAYNLRDQTSQESNRIYSDPSLAYEQKLAALQLLAQNTRTQLVATLGPKASETYLKTANWINAVERGSAVTFTATGSSIRGLPNPNAPAQTRETTFIGSETFIGGGGGGSVGTVRTIGSGTVVTPTTTTTIITAPTPVPVPPR